MNIGLVFRSVLREWWKANVCCDEEELPKYSTRRTPRQLELDGVRRTRQRMGRYRPVT